MHILLLITVGLIVLSSGMIAVESRLQANAGELFTYKIEPQLFNWTHQEISEKFRYRPSLQGFPDMPSFMRYKYSHEYHAGFLYGTPPASMAGKQLNLDIVAMNRQNYETRHIVLSIFVAHKYPTPNVVQMKIDNLNWVHFMDNGRLMDLRNIFRNDLWPESTDLSVVFMESAVNMGGRLPLRPQQREGVIVHVGSLAQFSSRLKELQEEVRPLYKLPSCTYKRTSVQKIFENVGFKLDWCAFKMVGVESPTEILYHNHGSGNGQQNEPTYIEQLRNNERWLGIAREDVPVRNYIDEFAFAFAIPGMIFAVLVGMLSAVLCFQHEKFSLHLAYPSTLSTVQMVQCFDAKPTQPVTTLKSLKDPNFLLDNASVRSLSPLNSFYQTDCAAAGAYARPKPPPYKGGTLGRNGVDI
ncbi:epsilon-sarcoglycan isoform X2 [Scaptodrosophila lebanonensis]|uniref:Epsilon-sarcoglycan isoform X2 n=1 Tax=Drosophila lebanonensis TaxID=7225 RepID=A0A6J2U800_DROLE|nr:epsilon-sarcoglycan isoform X2 [Scaptodrosophila lebanonensis]